MRSLQSDLISVFQSGVTLKVCGVTSQEDIDALIAVGVKVIGVNFWEHSKRYVSPAEGKILLQKYEGEILRVGVFVNGCIDVIKGLLDQGVIDVAQLHGDESPVYCEQLKSLGYSVIKALGVGSGIDISTVAGYNVDALLLDTYSPGVYGGTGRAFEWGVVAEVNERLDDVPIILAGGIDCSNIDQALKVPGVCMIDVASGAEVSPGVKSIEKARLLNEAVAKFNNSK